MQSIQKLKEELGSNLQLSGLVDVLKGIAMAKYRMLERTKEQYTQFLNTFENFFQMIDIHSGDHPFIQGGGRLGLVIVTSDEGFMGGLNTRVINEALKSYAAGSTDIIIIGEWGARYLQGLNFQFHKFPGVTKEKHIEDAEKIKQFVFEKAMSRQFSRLMIAYPKPISFTVQTPKVISILPCREIVAHKPKAAVSQTDIIQEGKTSAIIEYLMDVWIRQKLLEIFEDSNLSEFAARSVHLDQSHHLLSEKTKAIRLKYFRSRHEVIDKGIRESFSSRVTRRKK